MTATEILQKYDPEVIQLKGELVGKQVRVVSEQSAKKGRCGEVLNVSRGLDGKIFLLIKGGKSLFPLKKLDDLNQTITLI